MNVKVPNQQGPLGFCLIKNPNTSSQRFLAISMTAGSIRALEVMEFDKATIFDKYNDAQQWLNTLASTNRYKNLSIEYSIRSFNR